MNLGKFKVGILQQYYQYKSFIPNSINHDWDIDDLSLVSLLSKADMKLGELNAYSALIPDVDFFIKMHVNKEATASNRIEGTQTNIEDILQKKQHILPEKRDDWDEVHNYIRAMNQGIALLRSLPISSRLLCDMLVRHPFCKFH